jgi:regulator of nucleoside diphosphate kinase
MNTDFPVSSSAAVLPLPPIRIDASLRDRLCRFATQALDASPQVAQYLLDEIDRAELCPPETLTPDVATIGSRVRYRDPRTQRENVIVLTWPGEADLAAGKVSVLSPIGAALIGLTVGQRIGWSVEHGELRCLEVLDVAPA